MRDAERGQAEDHLGGECAVYGGGADHAHFDNNFGEGDPDADVQPDPSLRVDGLVVGGGGVVRREQALLGAGD